MVETSLIKEHRIDLIKSEWSREKGCGGIRFLVSGGCMPLLGYKTINLNICGVSIKF